MFRIQNNAGLNLELEPDANIEFEFNNWLLADSEDLPGSYSYPISFPLSTRNKKFISHSHLPESRPRDLPVTVWVNGIMLRQASMSYKISKTSGSGYLKVDAGELASKVKGVFLHEIITEKFFIYTGDPQSPFAISNAQKQVIIAAKIKEIAMAEPGKYPFTFFPVQNPDFGPAEVEGIEYVKHNVVNPYYDGNFLVDTAGKHGVFNVPFIYFTVLIQRLCAHFGYKATGSFMDIPDVKTWVIYNTQALYSTNFIVAQGYSVDLGMHVPYMTISDFLKALRDDFGLGVFFDANTREARFDLFRDIRDSSRPVKDLSAFVLKGYDNELPDEKGYSVISAQDDQDELFKGYEGITTKIREGQKDVKCSIGTLKMYKGTGFNELGKPILKKWLIPAASQKGNVPAGAYLKEIEYYNITPKHKNAFGLRLLSYVGFKEGETGNVYPFASSVSRSYDQTPVSGWSLDAAEKDSVYNQLGIPFYTFLATCRRLRYEMLLPLSQAKNLQFHQIYSIKGENQVKARFMLQKVNLNAPGSHGLLPAKVSFCMLLPPDVTPNRPDFEVFFAELYTENEIDNSLENYRVVTTVDLVIKVWRDQAKTKPGNPSNLPVRYRVLVTTDTGSTYFTDDLIASVSGHEFRINSSPFEDNTPEERVTWTYTILPSSEYIAL